MNTHAMPLPAVGANEPARRARRRVAVAMMLLLAVATLAGLATGAHGLSLPALWSDLQSGQGALIVGQIRAPRTLGAGLCGALLGVSGALAQGLFRNPLADPYLLGSAAGAALAVVLVHAAASLLPPASGIASLSAASSTPASWFAPAAPLSIAAWLEGTGLVVAAFAGAMIGVTMTIALAQGAVNTMRLLLCGIVVAVLLGAVSDLVTVVSPDALRGKQAFLLGSTSTLGWTAVGILAVGLPLVLWGSRRNARVLDALTLGEDGAASLGLDLRRSRFVLVALSSLATALAVSQVGLIAFVGLVAPHLVRRHAPGPHAWLLIASAGMGAALLLAADVISRAVLPPQELPVGVVTGVLGGGYLFVLLRRRLR